LQRPDDRQNSKQTMTFAYLHALELLLMTTKASLGQELLRKTARPGFIFVLSGQGVAFRRRPPRGMQ